MQATDMFPTGRREDCISVLFVFLSVCHVRYYERAGKTGESREQQTVQLIRLHPEYFEL